jgi:hypothetical protein
VCAKVTKEVAGRDNLQRTISRKQDDLQRKKIATVSGGRRRMTRTRMLVSTTALTSAGGTPDSLHGFANNAVDMTIGNSTASTSHLVDENG